MTKRTQTSALLFGLALYCFTLAACVSPSQQTIADHTAIAATVKAELTVESLDSTLTATPKPTPTTHPTSTPTPLPQLGSLERPYPFGKKHTLVDTATQRFEIGIMDVIRGEDAWTIVAQGNIFNDEPPSGLEYILLYIEVEVPRWKEDDPVYFSQGIFSLLSKGRYFEPGFVTGLPSEFPLNVKLTEGGSVAGWIPFFVYAGDSAPLLTAQAEGGHTLFFAAQPAVTAVPAPTTTLISTSEALLSLPVTSDGWQFNYRGPIDTIEHIELPSAPIYPAVGRFVVVPVQIDFVGEGSQVLSLGYLVGPANTAVEIRLVDAVGNEYPYDWTLTSHYYSSTGVQFDRARIVDSRQVKTQVVDCIFDVPPEAVLERLDIYEGPMYQRPDQFVGSIRLP